jgi:hypothetical protein
MSVFERDRRVGKEGEVEWLSENWFWVAVLIAFVVLHLFGHGGHGGHGGRDSGRDDEERPAGHRH